MVTECRMWGGRRRTGGRETNRCSGRGGDEKRANGKNVVQQKQAGLGAERGRSLGKGRCGWVGFRHTDGIAWDPWAQRCPGVWGWHQGDNGNGQALFQGRGVREREKAVEEG